MGRTHVAHFLTIAAQLHHNLIPVEHTVSDFGRFLRRVWYFVILRPFDIQRFPVRCTVKLHTSNSIVESRMIKLCVCDRIIALLSCHYILQKNFMLFYFSCNSSSYGIYVKISIDKIDAKKVSIPCCADLWPIWINLLLWICRPIVLNYTKRIFSVMKILSSNTSAL